MINMSTNTKLPPNHLDLDRTYVLSYVYDGDFPNQRTMEFSGAEIQKVFDMLPESIFDDGGAQRFKEMLYTNIIIGGRLLLGKPLSDDHPEQTINMMKLLNDGDQEAIKTVRFGFAIYLGLNIDEIVEQDIDAWEWGRETDRSLFFIFDTDDNGPLPEVTEEDIAEADAMLEGFKVRHHPSRLNTPTTNHAI